MLLLINLYNPSMQKNKIPSSANPIHKLEIKIPNFSRSKQKQPKSSSRPIKSKSTLTTSQPLYTHRTRDLSDHKAQEMATISKTNTYRQKSPRQLLIRPTATKLLKLRVDSKSPRNRVQSPREKTNQERYNTDIFKTHVNTSRNIDEVKKKLQMLSNKVPMKMTGKYFKKQGDIPSKLEDMNRTLKKMAELKTSKKSKFELKMLSRLGKSQTGDIILAVSNVNGILVAIKTFNKDKLKLEYLIDEMKIHLYCSHPNILPAYGYHIGRDEVYLVMEYGFCNLYQEILRKGPFTEEKTANYTRQILSGVEYLHRNGIIHRDLKPENVICLGDHLKITDFGWSIKTDKQRRTLCGTLDYISPEVAERSFYDNKIDCWSVGVLMYEMLTVQPPFSQEGHRYDFGTIVLPEHLSKDCCDLMLGLLKIDPQQRLSARQALDHSWMKSHNKNYLLFQRRQVRQLEFEIDELFID